MENARGRRSRKRTIIIAALLVAVLAAFLFATTDLALYVNFLLGNNIIVHLGVSNESLSLLHGQAQNVTVQAEVTANPFCTAQCALVFEDISSNATLGADLVNISAASPHHWTYTLTADRLGSGIALYRARMQCVSVQTTLCHGNSVPTARSALITLAYQPTPQEDALRSELKSGLAQMRMELQDAEQQGNVIAESLQQQAGILSVQQQIASLSAAKSQMAAQEMQLGRLQRTWLAQNMSLLARQFSAANESARVMQAAVSALQAQVQNTASRYNAAEGELAQAKGLLDGARATRTLSAAVTRDVSAAIGSFNGALAAFGATNALAAKEAIAQAQLAQAGTASQEASAQAMRDALNLTLILDVAAREQCEIAKTCDSTPIVLRNLSMPVTLADACARRDAIAASLAAQNASENFTAQGYPQERAFWSNVSTIVGRDENSIRAALAAQATGNSTQDEIAREALASQTQQQGEIGGYDLAPAKVSALLDSLPQPCAFAPVPANATGSVPPPLQQDFTPAPVSIDIAFDVPPPQCCVGGTCQACCTAPSCAGENYPVVFLNGHPFNKGVSAEYSLDSFDGLQRALEADGYLDAGAITVYTQTDTPQGIWGEMPRPVSIRASYYFDLFQTPQNYAVVQTKNQNIDEDAVRLKELLDIVKYKTGKQKAIIVAHSMGGLVARRYLQLFGQSGVAELVMIGTPNHGITPQIYDYCTVLGNRNECDDMENGSVFLQKLRTAPPLTMPVYNIIGVGCDVSGQNGDGIVTAQSAYLAGTHNIYINGTCSGLDILHVRMLNLNEHPETYGIIKNALGAVQ